MYFPYFRGKQYELITVRENAELLSEADFVPIIEPVRQTLSGLDKALRAICDAHGEAIVVVNPYHGDHAQNGDGISNLLELSFSDDGNISAGVLLKNDMSVEQAMQLINEHNAHGLALIHAGFPDARGLIDALGENINSMRQIFLEEYCGKLYRKHFAGLERILLRDGFQRRRNRDHPLVEPFSDLHVTFVDEGMNGFGDFLIAGDEYVEGGGPAYAVAIHLTFIDARGDNEMFIYHFKSVSQDTPTDPAGKFKEALNAMIEKLDSEQSQVLETDAVIEFRDLHRRGHFPGLGYVKKLSMQHHIETLANFLQKP